MEFKEVKEHWYLSKSTIKVAFIECGKTIWSVLRYVFCTHPHICWGTIVIIINVSWTVAFTCERTEKHKVEHQLFDVEQQMDSMEMKNTSYVKLSDKELNEIELDKQNN